MGQIRLDAEFDGVAMVRKLSGLTCVHHAHMAMAEPTIQQAFETCVREGATTIVVHPYFLSPGRHSIGDIPRLVAGAAKAFPAIKYCVTEPLGLHPKICEVILERAGIQCIDFRKTSPVQSGQSLRSAKPGLLDGGGAEIE